MRCSQCSTSVYDNAKFCPTCGQRMGLMIVESPQSRSSSSKSKSKSKKSRSESKSTAAVLYDKILADIRRLKDGERKVGQFKELCRAYGEAEMKANVFRTELKKLLGSKLRDQLIPDLLTLMQNEKQREALRKAHNRRNGDDMEVATDTSRSSITSSSGLSRDSISAKEGSSSLLKGPHNWGSSNKGKGKSCAICQKEFHWMRRRHQCRLCAEFYCDKDMKYLMIPEGQGSEASKEFEGNDFTPQRVCLTCAPDLEPMQTELCKGANQHRVNDGTFSRVPYKNQTMEMEVASAARSLQRFFQTGAFYTGVIKDNYIPVKLLREAKGIALFTSYKFGFILSGAGGTGIAIARCPDGSWSAPIALALHSVSVGIKAGVEFAYYLLVLRSDKAVKSLTSGSIGLDASADIAIGPFGRAANASAMGGKGGVSTSLMYAHCRGLYGGISLGGQVLRIRKDVNRAFYGRDVNPEELLSDSFPRPQGAQPLYDAIDVTFEQARILQEEKDVKDAEKEKNAAATAQEKADVAQKKAEVAALRQSAKLPQPPASEVSQGRPSATYTAPPASGQSRQGRSSEKYNAIPLPPPLSIPRQTPSYRLSTSTPRDSASVHYETPVKASGAEAAKIYQSVVESVRVLAGASAVDRFKANCRAYGHGETRANVFTAQLVQDMGITGIRSIMPNLARLIPDDEKRRALVDALNAEEQRVADSPKITNRKSKSKKKNKSKKSPSPPHASPRPPTSRESSSRKTSEPDVKAIHASLVKRIRTATSSDNAVKVFKTNCKSYGLSEMTSTEFYTYLYYDIGADECAQLIPDIIRILPNETQKKELDDLLHGRQL